MRKRIYIILSLLCLGILLNSLVIGGMFGVILETTDARVLSQETVLRRFSQPVKNLIRLTDVFYRAPAPEKPLPAYALEVDTEDLQEIESALPREAKGFLTDDAKVWVPGTFTTEGSVYKVKVRVRGLGHNHWRYAKKSWRVKFAKDDLFRGMREITLIIPEDREWTGEMLNVYRAAKFGLPHPPSRFITMTLNGSAPMLYFEAEHWGKPMLEKLALPGDSEIFKPDSPPGKYQEAYHAHYDSAYWRSYTDSLTPLESSEVIDAFISLLQDDAHLEEGFRERVETLFDLDQLTAWYALSLLSGNHHAHIGNVRLYHDPSTGKIIPFPWDISLAYPGPLEPVKGNEFWKQVFEIAEYKERTIDILRSYLDDKENTEDDLRFIASVRAQIESAAYRDPYKLPTNAAVKRSLDQVEKRVQANIDFLHNQLK